MFIPSILRVTKTVNISTEGTNIVKYNQELPTVVIWPFSGPLLQHGLMQRIW